MAATAAGGSIAVSGSPSCSHFSQRARTATSTLSLLIANQVNQRRSMTCLAVQESSTSTVEPVAAKEEAKKEGEGAEPPAAAAKAKPAAKAPAKPLPQLMEEEVIPSLRDTLEAQQDISKLELIFDENKLEGSFLKKGNPYTFWAFFPEGINGPKGFSISSYGSGVSTVEPFLVDEKKPTAKHIVFWVEKRLAAQGINPVWRVTIHARFYLVSSVHANEVSLLKHDMYTTLLLQKMINFMEYEGNFLNLVSLNGVSLFIILENRSKP